MRARTLALVVGGTAAMLALALWAASVLSPATFPAVALDAGRPRPQGDFLVGAFVEPTHFNPLTTTDPAVRTWISRLTHDGLCDLDPKTGSVRPALAESVVPDGDAGLRIALRAGLRFSDGTEVTADDVAFSHRCARTKGLPPMGAMVRAASMVEELAVVGPRELIARGLSRHWSARDLFTTGMPVLSRAAVLQRVAAGAPGRSAPAPDTPEFARFLAQMLEPGPGTGPYMLARDAAGEVAWQRGRHLDLVQNPHSWRRTARPEAWNVAGLRHLFLNDAAAQLALARSEQLDWLTGDVRTLVATDARLRASYRLVVYDPPMLGHYCVVWNCRRAPFSDPRVRRALSALFDRQAICDRVLYGDGVPATTWFKPGMPEVPDDITPPAHDPAAAAALLRAAGFGGPGQPRLSVEILGGADPVHRRILELASPSFGAAGIDFEGHLVEGGVLRDRVQRRDFAGVLFLKYHADPWIDPRPFFHSANAAEGDNWMGFQDGECDRLLDAAQFEADAGRRAATYRAFCRRVHELQPVALLAHPRTPLLLHARFRDAEVGATGLSLESWWVPEGEQRHRPAAVR